MFVMDNESGWQKRGMPRGDARNQRRAYARNDLVTSRVGCKLGERSLEGALVEVGKSHELATLLPLLLL